MMIFCRERRTRAIMREGLRLYHEIDQKAAAYSIYGNPQLIRALRRNAISGRRAEKAYRRLFGHKPEKMSIL